MPSQQPAVSGSSARSAVRFRWVSAWLTVGGIIALLLMGNAVRDYTYVSHLVAMQQVRHQLVQISVEVEQKLRQNEDPPPTLASVLAGSLQKEESVSLRDADGLVLEHLGDRLPESPFTSAEERDAFANREPLFKTMTTPAGSIVVEAFAMRNPRRPAPAARPAPNARPASPRFLVLEVALPLKSSTTSLLTPIRRNLALNLAAALSLLATVMLAAWGLRSYVKGQRLEEQVEIARQVQARLLPNARLQLPGVDLAAVYQPAEEVGGDFYDLFANGAHGFSAVIGDVSGKGLPAALLMGVIHGAVRTAVWQDARTGHEEESEKLNRLLCERASGNRFASMFWCVYNGQLRTLRYVNAGHCPPFLISRRDGSLVAQRLGEGGPVLGLLPIATYQVTTVDIAPGDLLVMYTDGLVEAASLTGEEYGDDRLQALLTTLFDEAPATIRDRMMTDWTAFSPPSDSQDDLTFTIIRF